MPSSTYTPSATEIARFDAWWAQQPLPASYSAATLEDLAKKAWMAAISDVQGVEAEGAHTLPSSLPEGSCIPNMNAACKVLAGLWFSNHHLVSAGLRGLKLDYIKRMPSRRVKVRIGVDQPGAGNIYSVCEELLTNVNPHLPA